MPVALITGGARRVGRAVALHLARHGWDVAITYNTSGDDAASLAQQIEGLRRQCVIIQADFADPVAASERIAGVFQQRFSRLDALMHNASLYERASLLDAHLELLRRFMAIHLETPILLTQKLAPTLRGARGTVLVMSDQQIERPGTSYSTYSVSKAAVTNAITSLARELAPEVTVNGIAPGVVAWPDDMPEAGRRNYLKGVPLARAGTPQDVAELVEFLCTKGKYITGQLIRLDGGRSV